MRDTAPVAGESLVAHGQATQHLPAGFDKYYVTDRMRKEGGIKENEALRWVRNSAMWEEHEKSDRIGEFQDTHDARLPLKKNGKPITQGDLVLMAYPMAYKEREDAEEIARSDAWTRELEEGSHPENFDRSRENLERLKARALEQSRRNGYVGPQSPTSGMSLEEAYRRFSVDAMEAEETRARRGPRRMESPEATAAVERMVARAETRSAAQKGRSSYGMGESGFARNPNSPLAQAQAKAGRGAK